MASFLRLLVLSLLFSLALPSVANEKFGKEEFDAQKELLQLKIDSSRELTQKDVDSLKNRIEALDKRLDDQNNRVGDIGIIMGGAGLLVTVLLAFGGLVGYFSVTRQAKEEAESASRQWFDANHAKLLMQIDKLQQAAAQARQTIAHKVDAVTQLHDTAITHIQGGMGKTGKSNTPINRDEEAALRQSAEEIKAKPEASYSYDDWNTRAFDAYHAKQYEDAALYWKYASNVPNAGALNATQALFNRAITLNQLKRHSEACTTYQQLIDTYSSDNTPAIRELLAESILNMGIAHGEMQKPTEEIATYQRLIGTYSSDTTPAIREQVTKAMVNMGITLREMQKPAEAIATYQQLIDTYSSDNTPAIHEKIARGMHNMGIAFGEMQKPTEEIATYQRLIDTYSPDTTPAIREHVAGSMLNMGVALGKMQQSDEAIVIYQQLIDTYSSDTTPAIREQVAKAILNTGGSRGQMQQLDEAISTFEKLIATYSSDTTPAIREQIANAFNGKGLATLLQAKKTWQNREQALSLLHTAQSDLLASLERHTNYGITHGNLAYVQWLFGEVQMAEDSFRSALAASQNSGEALYHCTLANTKLHTIPEDQGFWEMVERLWAEYQAAKSS